VDALLECLSGAMYLFIIYIRSSYIPSMRFGGLPRHACGETKFLESAGNVQGTGTVTRALQQLRDMLETPLARSPNMRPID
jgi:hypothetical protein